MHALHVLKRTIIDQSATGVELLLKKLADQGQVFLETIGRAISIDDSPECQHTKTNQCAKDTDRNVLKRCAIRSMLLRRRQSDECRGGGSDDADEPIDPRFTN